MSAGAAILERWEGVNVVDTRTLWAMRIAQSQGSMG